MENVAQHDCRVKRRLHSQFSILNSEFHLVPRDGREFWRSLDEWADTPEFRAWLADEFPGGVADALDGVTRRQVLKMMAASFALAGLTGCRQAPEERIVPRVRSADAAPVERPLYYATAVTRDGYAQGVLVKTHAGRPTKVEGNPDHPASLGATDVFTQAAILTLYDPDRSQTVYAGTDIRPWSAAERALAERADRARANGGRGLRLLTGPISSPTLIHQIRALLETMPYAAWHVYSAIDTGSRRAGSRLAFGRDVEWVHRVSEADVIVSFDADLLYAWPGSVRYAREFADRRRIRAAAANEFRMNRLYVAEPCPSVTGTNADHRLALAPSRIGQVAHALAHALDVPGLASEAPAIQPAAATEAWLRAAARDLAVHRGHGLVLAGESQPPAVHALVHAIDHYLGNFGSTTVAFEPFCSAGLPEAKTLIELVQEMEAGQVETLLIIDANPVYDAPADFAFAEKLQRIPFTGQLALYRDETAHRCHWHLPLAHELESWGDARAYDGTAGILQPVIEPLYAGRTALQVLSRFLDSEPASDREIVEAYWRARVETGNFQTWWEETLERGIVSGSAPSPIIDLPLSHSPPPPLSLSRAPDALELEYQPDPTLWDGRYANNGWLQELPKPITKLTWASPALLSPKAAAEFGLQNEDVIELEYQGVTAATPVWIVPGHAEGCITLPLGYGRWSAGEVGTGVGTSAYALRRSAAPWFDDGLQVRRTGDHQKLACTQNHQLMENRDLVRVRGLEDFRHRPPSGHGSHADVPLSLYPDRVGDGPQWGMSIDLSTCIGCNACTIACQAENNIPVIGADQVRRGRAMHWIRVDRYFEGPPEGPAMHHQPVPCMHCENAPCEVVCPVNATTHSTDGLNEMTYNRCIGTRYCSNNCPYKVRRFNFVQYADLKTPGLALLRNPDVTVRERGVMEKCTYCVQRIRVAQIAARKENRSLRDGEVLTACQQVCPTRAIVFGDIRDPASRVSSAKREPHDYGLLVELNTRPRTTYLARIKNPNPEMA